MFVVIFLFAFIFAHQSKKKADDIFKIKENSSNI